MQQKNFSIVGNIKSDKSDLNSLLIELFNIDSANSTTYTAACGAVFIELLVNQEMLSSEITGKKEGYTLLVNANVLNKLGDHVKTLKALPLYLPMVEVPKKYSKTNLGGYYLNDVDFRQSLIIKKRNMKYDTKVVDDNMYHMINGVSSTPFCINTELLDYLNEFGRMNNLLVKDPRIGLTDNVITSMRNNRKKSAVYKDYVSNYSKYSLQSHILSIATIYRNYDKIYFPIRLDSRGRIYCTPVYLNYQGTELAKALLNFGNKSKLYLDDDNSLDYLYSYGANCYGNGVDKQSRVKKVQ
jgi:DNA-directed RNA polymerase